jgi:hypothetical protein
MSVAFALISVQGTDEMSRRRKIISVMGLAVLVAASVGGIWCGLTRPRPSHDEGPPSPREPDFVVLRNLPVYLMPVAADAIAARRPGDEVWDALLPGIAADADSRTLLSRLYQNAPTELREGPVGQDAGSQAPAEGLAVAVRVHAQRFKDRVSTRQGHVYGLVDLWRVSTVQFHPARFHHPEGTPPEQALGQGLAAALAGQPDDFEVLLLVANDYLLRKQPGWQLFSHGFSADAIQVPTGGLAELRADLDRRIDDYVKRHTVSADLGDSKE